MSPEYITDQLVQDDWLRGDLLEWQKQTVVECQWSAAKKSQTETQWLKCSADSDADLGDAVDVRMSHTFSLTFSVYHWRHTRYVMRLGKYTVSLSEICLCASVWAFNVCLLDGVWINGHMYPFALYGSNTPRINNPEHQALTFLMNWKKALKKELEQSCVQPHSTDSVCRSLASWYQWLDWSASVSLRSQWSRHIIHINSWSCRVIQSHTEEYKGIKRNREWYKVIHN